MLNSCCSVAHKRLVVVTCVIIICNISMLIHGLISFVRSFCIGGATLLTSFENGSERDGFVVRQVVSGWCAK